VWREASRRLDSADGKRQVGGRRILDRVISAIEINQPAPRPLRRNLVAWQQVRARQAITQGATACEVAPSAEGLEPVHADRVEHF